MESRGFLLLTSLLVVMLYMKSSDGHNVMCYVCNITDCDDPFDTNSHTPQQCLGSVSCAKTKTTGGDEIGVIRYCADAEYPDRCDQADNGQWSVYECRCHSNLCNAGISPKATVIILIVGILFKIILLKNLL